MTESAETDGRDRDAVPEPPRRTEGPVRWGPRRTLAVVAIALAVGVAGSVSVTAITSGAGSERTGGPGGGAPGVGGGGGFGGMGQPGGAGSTSVLSDALHGEFTVETEQGTYRTKRLQRGTLTAVGDTSVTVRSGDDYRREYAVNSETVVDGGRSTLDELDRGLTVTVVATLLGGDVTATTISAQQSGSGSGDSTGSDGFPVRGGNSGRNGDSGASGTGSGGSADN
ncbi:hypothetical protein SAMN04487905_102209 [Actinopolyspora xinjiangensis]|uniref:DUF5666 domain-containing protein n=2 Tax=Actinopolyspora xinjiangensis TaxID=405564 RepID=A0A1H0QFJ0_9ACTN|nr:hypothetical protein SAMN04487905_102209 [Actinopolyspora xinjiangensis]